MIEFPVGAVLSGEEFEVIDSEHSVQVVYITAALPSPGESFSQPDEGEMLELVDGFHLFFSAPDEAAEHGCVRTYWGKIHSSKSLVEEAADQITFQSHHVAAAVYFHFDLTKFVGWNTDVIAALPQLFWFRIENPDSAFKTALEERLSQIDPFYKAMVRFLKNPNSVEFASERHDIEELGSFSFLYDNWMTSDKAQMSAEAE